MNLVSDATRWRGLVARAKYALQKYCQMIFLRMSVLLNHTMLDLIESAFELGDLHQPVSFEVGTM